MPGNPSELNSVNAFRTFWGLGYRNLLPIAPPGAKPWARSSLAAKAHLIGKIPGMPIGNGEWKSFKWVEHETRESDLDLWASWGAGVGLRLGDGVCAFDCDATSESDARKILEVWASHVPGPHAFRIGRSPKFAILFRAGPDVRSTNLAFEGADGSRQGVDLLGPGKQMVVAGIHPKTNQPYAWRPSVPPLDALPELSRGQVDAIMADLAAVLPKAARRSDKGAAGVLGPVDQSKLKAPLEAVRRAVRLLPNDNDTFPTHDDFVMMGYAIKAALADHPSEALDLFQEWAAKWEGNEASPDGNSPKVVEDEWRRMEAGPDGFRIGAPWIFDKAEELTKVCFLAEKAAIWFDKVEPDPEWLGGSQSPAAPRTYNFVDLLDAGDPAKRVPTPYLIKGMMARDRLSVYFGPSGEGKTFLILDIAAHVAAGRSWCGRRVKQGRVVYLVLEGQGGIGKRAEALLRRYAGAIDRGEFILLPQQLDLRNPEADMVPLCVALREIGDIALIVIDTASQAMAGGDENSSVDAGALLRNVGAIRERIGAHVMLVHHTGKDTARGARGWSGFKGNVDDHMSIIGGELHADKLKDYEDGWSVNFELEKIELRIDEDGDPETSCLIRYGDASPAADADLTESASDEQPTTAERPILDALKELEESASPNEMFSPKAIHKQMADAGQSVAQNWMRNALTRLAKKKLVYRRDGKYRTKRLSAGLVFNCRKGIFE